MLSRRGHGASATQRRRASSTRCRRDAPRSASCSTPDRRVDDPLTPPLEFARQIRDRFVGFDTVDAMPILEESADGRRRRTSGGSWPESLEISGDAQLAGMRAARPGAYEYEVKAAIEAVHYGRGAVSWAIPRSSAAGRMRPSSTTPTARGRCRPATCCWSTPRATTGLHDGRHHPHVSGQRHVLTRAEGYLPRSCWRAQQEGIEAAQAGCVPAGRAREAPSR